MDTVGGGGSNVHVVDLLRFLRDLLDDGAVSETVTGPTGRRVWEAREILGSCLRGSACV